MKRVKKIIRLFAFICLIVLACFGVGLSGGVPIPTFGTRKDKEENNIELVEEDGEKEI